MIRHHLPGTTDTNIMDILEQRMQEAQFHNLAEWLRDDGLDWLHKDDRAELLKERDKAAATTTTSTDGTKETRTARLRREFGEEFCAKRRALASAAAKRRGARPAARLAQPDWDDPDLSEQTVQNILPEGFRCYRDTYNSRWQLSWAGGRERKSRSWQLHGHGPSALMVVKHAWWVHESRGHGQCNIIGLSAAELKG